LALGFSDQCIEAMRYVVGSFEERVPARRIAYMRLPSKRAKKGRPLTPTLSPNGGEGVRGMGAGIYRKSDVLQFLGPEFSNGNRTEKTNGTNFRKS